MRMGSLKSDDGNDYQDVPSYIGAMARRYAVGDHVPLHRHKRAQLIFALSGVMPIVTADRHWIVPPQRAIWIPGDVDHGSLKSRSIIELRTIYVQSGDVTFPLPKNVAIVNVSPLLRELIIRAVDLPIEDGIDDIAAHIVALIFDELNFSAMDGFHLPRVQDPRLARVAAELMADPGDTRCIEELASLSNMSPRTFARHFEADTGCSFSGWRQQLRLAEAVARLMSGETVTAVALALGYESTSSLSRMFKRVTGTSPTDLLRHGKG